MTLKALFPLLTKEESGLPFYVKSIGISDNQEPISRSLGYSDYHWLHCIKGSGKLIVEHKEYIINENMGFFLYPGISHEYYSLTQPWETHWLTFDGYAVQSLLKLLGLREFEIFNIPNIKFIELLINDTFISSKSDNTNRVFEASALLYRFLMELKSLSNSNNSNFKVLRFKQLQPVITYIENNFSVSPTLNDLADVVSITPQYLCRLFKEVYNMRPFVYLTKYRLQKAKEFIIERTELPIKDISKLVGYNDVSYFCSIFKEYEGMTPLKFKSMYHVN